MILPGNVAVARGIIKNLKDTTLQTQPNGIDLSLRRILTWTTASTIDFTNHNRTISTTSPLPLSSSSPAGSPPTRSIHLGAGNYIVEFNEKVDMPLDIMGQVFVRSSLWRSGVLVAAGVIDSGYRGAVGGMLQVLNPHGIVLQENARLAQMVFCEMKGEVEGYRGVYQGVEGL